MLLAEAYDVQSVPHLTNVALLECHCHCGLHIFREAGTDLAFACCAHCLRHPGNDGDDWNENVAMGKKCRVGDTQAAIKSFAKNLLLV